MPGIDKPTGRVVALIVLLIAVAAALRGYLPAQDRGPLAAAGGNRAAAMFVIAALAGTLALMAVAVIARLRDPRAVAPTAGDVSDMIGGGKGRPSWRVVLIGLAVIVAWLLIAMLLAHLFAPHDVTPSAPPSQPTTPSAHGATPPPKQNPHNDPGDMVGVLLVSTVPLLLIIVAATVINARRRWRRPTPGINADDHVESRAPTKRSELLVRAAEVGLAEMADLSREPREAIIACYAAMERELANVPGAAPQDFDTPTEVLARAIEHHALHADNAVQLVNLFEEARFSPHVMNEGHREVAVRVLQLVLDELAVPAGAGASGGIRMKRLIALGVCLIVGTELLVLILHDRRFVLAASGVAAALVLLNIRRFLGHGIQPAAEPDVDDLGDALRRWLATTETTIRWSDSTRADWDRHLRPMLARRFEIATGHGQAKDPTVFQASGQMLFGPELWEWVNPNNVARTAGHEPGPGRAKLEEILQRLAQV